MVSCNDNYKIISQVPKALNEFDLPYGGINMIFFGDFAQLPPVFGSPLYSGTMYTQFNIILHLPATWRCNLSFIY